MYCEQELESELKDGTHVELHFLIDCLLVSKDSKDAEYLSRAIEVGYDRDLNQTYIINYFNCRVTMLPLLSNIVVQELQLQLLTQRKPL